MSVWPPAGSFRTHGRGSVPPVRHALRCRPRRGVVRRSLAVAALLVAVGSLLPATTTRASADVAGETGDAVQDAPPNTSRKARLVVNGLQAVVGPANDGPLPASEEEQRLPSTLSARVLVENLTDEPLDGLRLVVTVHERVTTRSTLRAALDGPDTTGLGDIEHLGLDMPVDSIPAGRFAQLEIAVDAEEAGLIDDENDVTVHPVAISVVQGFPVLDEVRTAAVGVARPVARPLQGVALAPLDGPVPSTVDPPGPATALLPGGRLDRILRALEAAPSQTATVVPAAHTAEDLQRLVDSAVPGATDMLARLQTVVTERAAGVVSAPYALADVPALAATASTTDLATASIIAGDQRLRELVGEAPEAGHMLLPGQTPASLDLAPWPAALLMPWDESAGPDLTANPSADIPPAMRTAKSESERSLDVLVGDPWITDQLASATGLHGWEVDAHRVVAETAMTFAQAPSRGGRVLAVVPPVGWEAPGRLADELYLRLAGLPWLRLADPETIVSEADVTAPWNPAPGVDPERTAMLGRVAWLQDRLDGLAAAVVDIEERPAVVARGDDLLRAVSIWPGSPPDHSRTVLDSLAEDIDAAIGEVIIPDASVVTLASERGVIPITVQHPEGVPLDVLVEVATQGRLVFPNGTSRPVRLEEGGTATVSFEATALGRGTFPLRVTVRTPTGDVPLAAETVSVRASAVSRPALLVIGGVVLLLLLVGRLRRPDRTDRPRLEVVR